MILAQNSTAVTVGMQIPAVLEVVDEICYHHIPDRNCECHCFPKTVLINFVRAACNECYINSRGCGNHMMIILFLSVVGGTAWSVRIACWVIIFSVNASVS